MAKKETISIILFCLFLSILVTFPAILHISDKIIGDSGDSYQFIGFQYLAKKEFFEGHFPFGLSNYWRYPYGVVVPNVIDGTFYIFIGVLIYNFISDPVIVCNLSVLILLFFNCFITYKAFRYAFTPQKALVATVMYGTSFYALSKLGGHFNLVLTAGFPAFLFSVLHFHHTHGSRKSFFYLSLSTLIIAFASLQYPLIFLGSLPVIIPLVMYFFPTEFKSFVHTLWERKIYVLYSAIFVLSVFLLFHGSKLFDLVGGDVIFPTTEIVSPPIVNFIVPNAYLRTVSSFVTNSTTNWIEYVVFVGYAEMALFLLAGFTVKKTRVTWFLIVSTVSFLIIAAGTQKFLSVFWPYQYLFHFFPYRGVIEPDRYVVVAYLFMTILNVIYLERFQQTRIVEGIIVLLILTRLPYNFQLNPTLYNKAFIDKVREAPSRAVLDIPVRTDWWNGQYYDMYSVYYEKPIVNSYIHWSGNTVDSLKMIKFLDPLSCYLNPEEAKKDFSHDEAVDFKKKLLRMMDFYGIRTIVIHKDFSYQDTNCERTRKYMDVVLDDKKQWLITYEDDKKQVLWLKGD